MVTYKVNHRMLYKLTKQNKSLMRRVADSAAAAREQTVGVLRLRICEDRLGEILNRIR